MKADMKSAGQKENSDDQDHDHRETSPRLPLRRHLPVWQRVHLLAVLSKHPWRGTHIPRRGITLGLDIVHGLGLVLQSW